MTRGLEAWMEINKKKRRWREKQHNMRGGRVGNGSWIEDE